MLAPRSLLALGLLAAAVSACKVAPEQTVEPADVDDPTLTAELERAALGVDDPELAALLREDWHDRLIRAPMFASRLGVRSFDDRWSERGPAARAAAREQRAELLARARALGERSLSEQDRVTLELFIAELEATEATQVCETWAWSVSTRDNPLTDLGGAVLVAHVDDELGFAALLARYRAFPAVVAAQLADLQDGLSRGLVADKDSLQRTIEMLDRQLAMPIDEWSALEPVAALAAEDPRRVQLRAIVVEAIEPALREFTEFLRTQLLPSAREGAQIGVAALPNGAACYAALIQLHTSESPEAEQLHQLGLEHIARIDQELRPLGQRVFGTDQLDEILARLRSDPSLYFETDEQVEQFAIDSLRAAEAAAPKWFGRLPHTPCEVRRIPDYEAPFTTIAYYNQPSDDEPGYYYINTFAPTTRPRYEARVLAIHEAVPGHHTQIALAQELADAPAFRRHGGTTVFVEGWALYTERLADEMGLYESDLDRLGMLSYDAWRASRLVVDTGIHQKGWTRAQAVEFMLAHTALAENNIVNEVDRYVGWPGQALAYKYGQIELLQLRSEAEAALGERFDIAGFHDVVLGAGAVTLPVLRRRVRAWIEDAGG